MIKISDFFKGIENQRETEIIEMILDGRRFNVTDEEADKIIETSTRIFRRSIEEEILEFEQSSDENRLIMHWIAGLNTKEYLKVFK